LSNFGNFNHQKKDVICNEALEPSRVFGKVKTNGVTALANAHFPLISKVYDISPFGLTIWSVTDYEITDHEISMDILVYNAQTNNECFMREVRGKLRSKKAVIELQSKRTVWHLKVEFLEMAAADCDNLTLFLEKESQYSCLSDCTSTFSQFACQFLN
jgi:hypothetical protein